ncbi:histidine kinase [Alkalihalobacillus alcalophilus ATCC 27647 = CGMCC 1.3604]|uniref:histidine kinase n=1 Tax=Alkalihalobacillus alcalophilus ATCC 27647 = CGMCC 1.3604 TaxID=1218173 RepID=A0A094WJS6_ALKAL|nr:ATP-binding protein [Alkalihalobacillus alcalophilus]KGA98029.1 histidine kinase [Alkalihalobacillus alcalophilus ATCC 27647 = CGMCC 1.3604]MED1561847.1 ATP-binding protein [Alkalihalobacillus alcalophilus]THG88702.1 histidine kinase [Alkalihalobacillus alcalophilus ATCC 27647 = CGMCC 1.3604]
MFKSLRMKLFMIFFFVTFLPLIFIAYITFQSQKEDIENQHEQLLYALGESAAVSLDDFIQERFKDVRMLTNNPIISNQESSIDEIQDELIRFVSLNDLYFGAILIDESGTVAVDVDNTVVGSDMSERVWVQETFEGGDVYLSDIYMSDVINRPILILAGSVKDENGDIFAIVSPSFNLTELWDRVDMFTRQQQSIGLEGHAFLVNGNGDIIAHPQNDIILRLNYFENNQLTAERFEYMVRNRLVYHNEEVEQLQYFVQLDKTSNFDNDWYVGISVPYSNIEEPLNQLINKYLLLFSCVLIIVVIAVFKLSNYIVKPLQKLVFATSDFAFGKMVYPLSTNSYHEVDTLTRTFNMMTRRLLEREKSHQKSSLILETTNNGILAFQKDSRLITTFNRTCEELFGVKKEAVIGLRIDDLIKHNDAFSKFVECAKLNDVVEKKKFNSRYEFLCHYKEESRYFFMSVQPLPSLNNQDEFEGVLLVFNDVTDKREMENELNRSEKLQMVGQLAAGFAHEIRNPLTTIRGFIQLFGRSNKISDEHRDHYGVILKEIDRVNEIISELLNMANPNSVMVKEETDVNEVIKGIHFLYQTEVEWRRGQFTLELEKLPLVVIERNKLHQVLMNLVKNSLEAISVDGHLIIKTYSLPEEKKIFIKVIDNGEGMDERTLEKLGTPFFTTKESGTGLGIITCFRLIEELKGTIEIESEKNEGTTFTIQLPVEE